MTKVVFHQQLSFNTQTFNYWKKGRQIKENHLYLLFLGYLILPQSALSELLGLSFFFCSGSYFQIHQSPLIASKYS